MIMLMDAEVFNNLTSIKAFQVCSKEISANAGDTGEGSFDPGLGRS